MDQGLQLKGQLIFNRVKIMPIRAAFLILILFLIAPITHADEQVETPPGKDSKSSPWLLLPFLTNTPKLGTSVGAMGAYLHQKR